MRSYKIKILLFALVMLLPLMRANAQGASSTDSTILVDPSDTVSLQTFRDAIPAEDGQWIKVDPNEVDPNGVTDNEGVDPDINQDYVWRPNNVDVDWNPYSNGYWEYTNCGWMWVSYYSWGWGPYHYGRWWCSDRYGWVWSPGYTWAPCWVSWNYCNDYVGWYPLSPRCRWHHGYNVHNCNFKNNNWTFVEYQHFSHTNITKTVTVDKTKYPVLTKEGVTKNDITSTGGKVINQGPDATKIENTSGQKIRTRNIDNIKKIPETKTYADKNSPDVSKPRSVQPKSDNTNSNGKNGTKGFTNDGKKSNDNGYKPGTKHDNGNTGYKPNTKRDNGNTGYKPKTKNDNGNTGYKPNTKRSNDSGKKRSGDSGTKKSNGNSKSGNSKSTIKSGKSNNGSSKGKK